MATDWEDADEEMTSLFEMRSRGHSPRMSVVLFDTMPDKEEQSPHQSLTQQQEKEQQQQQQLGEQQLGEQQQEPDQQQQQEEQQETTSSLSAKNRRPTKTRALSIVKLSSQHQPPDPVSMYLAMRKKDERTYFVPPSAHYNAWLERKRRLQERYTKVITLADMRRLHETCNPGSPDLQLALNKIGLRPEDPQEKEEEEYVARLREEKPRVCVAVELHISSSKSSGSSSSGGSCSGGSGVGVSISPIKEEEDEEEEEEEEEEKGEEEQ